MGHTTITVLGAGYVGLTTAAVFANSGYTVYLVEPDPERLKAIQAGRPFFYEFGLEKLTEKAVSTKQLIPTDSYQRAVPKSGFIFSCVGTPDNPDGSSNLAYVFAAAEEAAKFMKPGTIYVQKSTVPVGTGAKVSKIIGKYQSDFEYVSNPEFLREGTALLDTLYFDRVVVGGQNRGANLHVLDLYVRVETRRDELAQLSGIKPGHRGGRLIETNLSAAELVKVTSNAFMALKLSFANSIAKLADQVGADINQVMEAVGADRRIGHAFLDTGRGYGGGCFPKDVSGLIASAADYGVDMPIMVAATEVNDSMIGYITNKTKEALGGLDGKRIAVLGLSFKSGTSDTRRSPGVQLANSLSDNGSITTCYDPAAMEEAGASLRENIRHCSTLEAAIKGVDAVLIATTWPMFLDYDPQKMADLMKGTLLVDAVNAFNIPRVKKSGLQYLGIGRK